MSQTAASSPLPAAPSAGPSAGPSEDARPVQRRAGRQRTAVAALLDAEPGFTSAQDLYARLREQGNPIGLATVYRALQALVEDGAVDVLRTGDDGEAVYRRCSTGHHHHLVCRRCGTAVEVEGRSVEAWAQRTAAEHGFTDVDHVVEIFGTCAACAAVLVADRPG